MKELCISTYYLAAPQGMSFGAAPPDPVKLLHEVKNEEFDGVEALFHFTPELYELTRKLCLKVPVGYYGVEEDGSIQDAEYYHKLGVKYVQSGNHPLFDNYDNTMRAIEVLNKQAAIAKNQGFKIYIHNHPQDFKWNEISKEYCWETVARNMDIEGCVFQLDVGWANIAGVDVIWLLKKYGHLVKSMHIKPFTAILGVTAVDFLFSGAGGKPDVNSSLQTAEQQLEFSKKMERLSGAQGRMVDSLRDYKEIMELAEQKGCESFILERDFFSPEQRQECSKILHEDISAIRKFW